MRVESVKSAFWPAFWLGAVLVGTKAFYLSHRAPYSVDGVQEYVAALAAISYRDVLFALAFGALHGMVLRVAAGVRRVRAGSDVVFCFLCLLSAAYAVVSLELFTFFLSPITYPLLYLLGDARNLGSSVAVFATPSLVATMVAAAALSASLVGISPRLAARMPARRRGALGTALAIAVAGWAVWGRAELAAEWGHRIDRRIAENPHWSFLTSAYAALAGESPIGIPEPVAAADLDDFLTIAERVERPAEAGFVRPAALSSKRGPGRRPQIRNVIVVVLESLSARSLEIYGSPYPATPNLSAAAAEALVFDDFYCHAGRSSESLAAILLSVHPRISWQEITDAFPRLPGASVPEILKTRGYRTAFVTPSDLSWANWEGFLSGRGFDEVRQWDDLDCTGRFASWGVEDRCMVDDMIRWIDEDPEAPFFLTGWSVQTHHPYEPTPGVPLVDFFGAERPPDDYDLGRYLNVLHETDRHLGRLFAALRARGLADQTLVVLVGDHGEAFGEPHDAYGHGSTLFEEHVRVPMMLWSPALFPRGGRSKTIGSHVDLNPTISEILHLPPAGAWQGRSLFDPTREPRAYFFVARDDTLLGLREEGWKYVLDVTGGREELFDLTTDPDEQRNVASLHPQRSRRLRERLAARVEFGQRFYGRIAVKARTENPS